MQMQNDSKIIVLVLLVTAKILEQCQGMFSMAAKCITYLSLGRISLAIVQLRFISTGRVRRAPACNLSSTLHVMIYTIIYVDIE